MFCKEEDEIINKIVNNNFKYANEEFINYDWKLERNEINHIIYSKDIYPCDKFIIELKNNKIYISIPLLKSNILYSTSFNNYFTANEYIINHLKNFENEYVIN